MVEVNTKRHEDSWAGEQGGMPSTYRFNEPLSTAHLVYVVADELKLRVTREGGEGTFYDDATWGDTSLRQRRVLPGQVRYGVDFSDKPAARPLFHERLRELKAAAISGKPA